MFPMCVYFLCILVTYGCSVHLGVYLHGVIFGCLVLECGFWVCVDLLCWYSTQDSVSCNGTCVVRACFVLSFGLMRVAGGVA